ncbi:MAG: hypothetical protein ACREE5_06475 [Acetobacteraceae bacterium]
MRPASLIGWSLALGLAIAALNPVSGAARPYRGSIPWSFLLCKFSDSPAPPHDLAYFRNMLLNTGTKGLADYVRSVSNGRADLGGSAVHGWYTEPHTLAYEQKLTSRWQRVQDCLDTAAASTTDKYVPPAGQRIYVITSPGVDLAGWENTGAIGGDQVALPEIAHEFGHGVGLQHSWSNDTTWKDASWAGPGEYDNPWDLMSAANIYVDPTGAFGGGPTDLNAHHLDEMGWLPKSRIETLGVDGILARTLTLAALTHPEAAGYLIARIPFDKNDRFHYYTVEYRTADGWDSGIPAAIVLINEVKDNGSYYQTTLIRTLGNFAGTGNGPPVQSLSANGVSISVQSTAAKTAVVKISTSFALPCAQGFVWREASSIDRVCVPSATRAEAAADNAKAGSRHLANAATCVQGFVWREAFPGDFVCVTPMVRSQARADDANAYNRVNQTAVTYGPNTCQNGYVWRDGDDTDYVCVPPPTRTLARADNAAAGTRHVSGSDICLQGFVWREAWPGDHVCVAPATRSQARADNGQATNRLWKLFAALPSRAPRFDDPAPSPGPAGRWNPFAVVATARAAEPHTEAHSPAPVSEPVMRVRLAKLGYTNVQKLVRSGDEWVATILRNGTTQTVRFHALSGALVTPLKK